MSHKPVLIALALIALAAGLAPPAATRPAQADTATQTIKQEITGGGFCATRSVGETEAIKIREELQRFKAKGRDKAAALAVPIIHIPVHVHVINNGGGLENGDVPEWVIEDQRRFTSSTEPRPLSARRRPQANAARPANTAAVTDDRPFAAERARFRRAQTRQRARRPLQLTRPPLKHAPSFLRLLPETLPRPLAAQCLPVRLAAVLPRVPQTEAAEETGRTARTPSRKCLRRSPLKSLKETSKMTNRRFTILTFAAVMLGALLVPAAANAQQGSIWDRIRERARQEREDDYRRGRRDDDYRRNGRISDYERRALRDVARRLESRSRDLERDVDRLLDHSRYDGSQREDRINNEVQGLRRAADRFQNAVGNGNELNRSQDEARQLFTEAAQVDRLLSSIRLDSRTYNDWAQIRTDLRTVADIYGIRFRDFNDGNYRRDDEYYRRRDEDRRRRGGNNRWE